MRFGLVSSVVFALIGCAVGPRLENFGPAQQPAGVEATLNFVRGAPLKGELLEVRDDGLLVLNGTEVTLVPYQFIRKGTFHQTSISIENWSGPNSTDREKLRLLSRFPQGLNSELLSALVAAYRQEKLTVWNR